MKTYTEEIIVDVEARLHLQHTDKPETDHYIQKVMGRIVSHPNTGDYAITLNPENQVRFSQITSGPCIVLILLFILDWPKSANSTEAEKRKSRGLLPPLNFLDLSNGEYDAIVRLNFEDGYAFKKCSMRKIEDNHYKAVVDTVHRYPSTKSLNLIKILPHDVTLTDAGPGKLIGRSQVRWLRNDNTILSGDAEIVVDFTNQYARLPQTEVFSYEFNHCAFSEYPFIVSATGVMRAVDTPPIMVEFDSVNKIYIE